MGEMILERLASTIENFIGIAVDFLPRLVAMLIVVLLGSDDWQ